MNEKATLLSVISIFCLLQPFAAIQNTNLINGAGQWITTVQDEQLFVYTKNDIIRSFATPNETIDQEQSTHCGKAIALHTPSDYYAQQFVPTHTLLTKISLFLGVNGTIPNGPCLSISIGKNLDEPLKTRTIDSTVLTKNGSWIDIAIPVLTINANHSYYIICHPLITMGTGFIEWYFDIDDSYQKGCSFFMNSTDIWVELDLGKDLPDVDFCFRTIGVANIAPEQPTKPDGPTEGKYETPYTFSTSSIDQNGDVLYYKWNWGDGETTDWIGPYESGEICSATHIWMVKGSYLIQVKSKDCWDSESPWSEPLTIRMKKIKQLDPWLLFFFIR